MFRENIRIMQFLNLKVQVPPFVVLALIVVSELEEMVSVVGSCRFWTTSHAQQKGIIQVSSY